jgi:hypothetical protein
VTSGQVGQDVRGASATSAASAGRETSQRKKTQQCRITSGDFLYPANPVPGLKGKKSNILG